MLTKEQLQRIYDYNKVRHLTVYSEEKELGFKIEEIDEWYKAENDLERVDALCDLIVFAGGVMFKNDYGLKDYEPYEFISTMPRLIYNIQSEITVIKIALRMIYKLGYDPTECMDEVLKHIESREGEYCEETGKFQKYTTPEYKEKWYEPQYQNCLLLKPEKEPER